MEPVSRDGKQGAGLPIAWGDSAATSWDEQASREEKTVKKACVLVWSVALLLSFSSFAAAKKAASTAEGAKPGAVAVDVVQLTATVKALDAQKKVVTLEGKDGKTLTVNAKNARNFDQIKVGDKVSAKYVEELALYVRKADAPPDAELERTVALAPKGEMPGGLIAETIEILANVEDIDYKKRTVTVKGPEGDVRTLKVGKDVKNFKEVKKGDQVVLMYTEVLALEVTRP